MRATFSGYTTAQLALSASQNWLNVTGQNISNINTVGYTKQSADQISLNFTNPDQKFTIGYGAMTTGVSQSRDPYLDLRYRTEIATVGEKDVVYNTLSSLESILDEVAKSGIQDSLSDLMSAFQDLSGNVTTSAYEEAIMGIADAFTQLISSYSKQIDSVEEDAIYSLDSVDVPNVNGIISSIVELNSSIEKAELLGSGALELKDTRNLLLDELASYMDLDIKYVATEVQPGVSIDRLVVSLSQEAYDDEGNKYTYDIPVINGSFGGSFQLEETPTGEYGITFTSAIGDAMKDDETISSLNNLISGLANLNDTLDDIAQKIATAEASGASNLGSLMNLQDGYIGMRDNFINNINALIDIEVEYGDNGKAILTFVQDQITEYDEVTTSGLFNTADPEDPSSNLIYQFTTNAAGDLLLGVVADGVIVGDPVANLGPLDVSDADVETLNNYINNIHILNDSLDAVSSTLADKQAVIDSLTLELDDINESTTEAYYDMVASATDVSNAEIEKNNAYTAWSENVTLITALKAQLEDNTLTQAQIDEINLEISDLETYATDNDLEGAYNTANDAYELAVAFYDSTVIAYNEARDVRSEKLAEIAEAEKGMSELEELKAGLLSQRDDFMLAMQSVTNMTFTFDENDEKIQDITFITKSVEDADPAEFSILSDNGDYAVFSLDADGNVLIDGSIVQPSLTTEFLTFVTGSFKGSLDTINYSGENSTLRGINYYEKQVEEFAYTFATLLNDINTNKSAGYNTGYDADGMPILDADGNAVSPTGIPQYNYDGSPLTDDYGNQIYHDSSLQVDSEGNYIGNNILFEFDINDPSKTVSIADGWKNGTYGITKSIVDGSASGANDNILNFINALSSDQTFSTTTSEPPFYTGDAVSSFTGSFYDYFASIATTLGLDIKTTATSLENAVTLIGDIADSRNAISGVNLDEEGVNLLRYQQSYSAAARLMTTLDEAMDTLLNMGKVGR